MPPATRTVFRLCCWIGVLLLFFCVIGPWLFSLSPAWQRYDAVQEEHNIHSGAIYYSDVPVTQESEEATRKAVREGMANRMQRRLEERKAAQAGGGADGKSH
ncbi:hypothetical protein [Desulfovibrio sp.]|uniref:hypothetical protein n=1 Tax=Desulfovibrio sp. TaxID=885 RepID=UPI0025C3F343|nr:hypothetical protein [Desulfovibrio sp.]